MGRGFRAFVLAAIGTLVWGACAHATDLPGGPSAEPGGRLDATFILSCENGRTYPIRARAIAVDGDVVTAYLLTFGGESIHVRLIPMGFGYRYAGPGIWFDGLRGEALLYLTKYNPVPCHVVAS